MIGVFRPGLARQKKVLRAALLVLLPALFAFGGLALLQNHLLYFPDRVSIGQMEQEARATGLAPWPASNNFRGLLHEAAGTSRATLLLFHGNAGHAGHREFYVRMLAPLGVRVILAEYPGYGPRAGELGEDSLVADATATLDRVRQQFGGPLIVAGESLGAGVAAAAAARSSNANGIALLLLTPWDRLENVASYHYPLIPVRWILRDRYDSAANLARHRGAIAVVAAGGDAIVPARFARALQHGLNSSSRLIEIPGAGHNDWFDHVDARWWQEVIGFLLAPPIAPAS